MIMVRTVEKCITTNNVFPSHKYGHSTLFLNILRAASKGFCLP